MSKRVNNELRPKGRVQNEVFVRFTNKIFLAAAGAYRLKSNI